MTKEYILQKSKEINQYAISKGFWTPDRSLEEKLMMVITEISEAVEADRVGLRADLEMYKMRIDCLLSSQQRKFQPIIYRDIIKNTIEEEFADIAIRLLDLVAHFDINVYNYDFYDIPEEIDHDFNKYTFPENALFLVQCASPDNIDQHEYSPILATLSELTRWAKSLKIYLPMHIDEKLNYLKSTTILQVKKY